MDCSNSLVNQDQPLKVRHSPRGTSFFANPSSAETTEHELQQGSHGKAFIAGKQPMRATSHHRRHLSFSQATLPRSRPASLFLCLGSLSLLHIRLQMPPAVRRHSTQEAAAGSTYQLLQGHLPNGPCLSQPLRLYLHLPHR